MPGRRLTDEQKQWMVDQYLDGAKLNKIADDLGCSYLTVWRNLSKLDVFKPRKGLTPEQRDQFVAWVEEGVKSHKIRCRFGLNGAAFDYYKNILGLSKRPNWNCSKRLQPADLTEIQRLRIDGRSIQSIADEFGVAYHTIQYRLSQMAALEDVA